MVAPPLRHPRPGRPSAPGARGVETPHPGVTGTVPAGPPGRGAPPMTTDSDRRSPPCALVIFGASGDLTARKLLPAVEQLAGYGALPAEVGLVGVARTPMSDEEFRAYCRQRAPGEGNARWAALTAGARYVAGDYDDPATYARLAEVLGACDRDPGTAGNRVYYFATPPRLFGPIATSLGKAGLSRPTDGDFVRAVIEKPFGWDEDSARDLYTDLTSAFDEEQIFRIDHYRAKETVQNLLALRFANSVFEPIWNRTWVDNVQITVAETIGVGSRGGFYETAGAMRDIVQNHVLQVLSLFLMEPPTSFRAEAIRDEKVKLLRAMPPRGPAGHRRQRGARPVHPRGHPRGPHAGLPGRAGGRPAQLDRDIRRPAAGHRQLALDGRAGLRADRQAAARTGHRGRHRVPPATATAALPGHGNASGARRARRPRPAGRGAQSPLRCEGAWARVPGAEGLHGLLLQELRGALPRRLRAGHPRRPDR